MVGVPGDGLADVVHRALKDPRMAFGDQVAALPQVFTGEPGGVVVHL
jgi:hypothetical protein